MDRTEIVTKIRKLEKQVKKTSKLMKSSKADVKEKAIQDLIEYQKEIDDYQKQLDIMDKSNMKHAIPIKSSQFEDDSEMTDVLKSTEDEIIVRPVEPINGTEVLYMNLDRRLREKDYQVMMRNVITKHIDMKTDPKEIQNLNQKLGVINSNISKLEAAMA